MYFFGRGVSAFFNQLFKWLFWNKTGQKLLFSILIVVIFFVFIKCGEVAAVEDVNELNADFNTKYENIINDTIIRIWKNIDTIKAQSYWYQQLTDPTNVPIFYYSSSNTNDFGLGYSGGSPLNNRFLHVSFVPRTATFNRISQNTDWDGIVGYSFYKYESNYNFITFNFTSGTQFNVTSNNYFYTCNQAYLYVSDNWSTFINSLNNNDTETIIELLSSIEDSLTNTEPTSETDSFVEVDSSSVDDLSSASVDNVFSNMTTNFANKFTNYDLSTVNSFVWNLNGTRITFYSDTLYKMIQGTFFETLLSMLWYYIFGHYAFVWLSNIIHKIKDGSILDGLEVNEVITKEML